MTSTAMNMTTAEAEFHPEYIYNIGKKITIIVK